MLACHASSRGRSLGTSRKVFVFLLACCGVAIGISGCGGTTTAASPGTASSGLKVSQGDFGAQFDRSRCDDRGKQVVTSDTDGDGKPDVIKLFTLVDQGGQKVQQLACRQVDLNHDGKMDIIYTYGPGGTLMAEDFDLDFDGKFDERIYYQDGKKVRMERDMDGDGRPDYVEFYEGGKLVRVERDRQRDGSRIAADRRGLDQEASAVEARLRDELLGWQDRQAEARRVDVHLRCGRDGVRAIGCGT